MMSLSSDNNSRIRMNYFYGIAQRRPTKSLSSQFYRPELSSILGNSNKNAIT